MRRRCSAVPFNWSSCALKSSTGGEDVTNAVRFDRNSGAGVCAVSGVQHNLQTLRSMGG